MLKLNSLIQIFEVCTMNYVIYRNVQIMSPYFLHQL